jgi:hypothetical protein
VKNVTYCLRHSHLDDQKEIGVEEERKQKINKEWK